MAVFFKRGILTNQQSEESICLVFQCFLSLTGGWVGGNVHCFLVARIPEREENSHFHRDPSVLMRLWSCQGKGAEGIELGITDGSRWDFRCAFEKKIMPCMLNNVCPVRFWDKTSKDSIKVKEEKLRDFHLLTSLLSPLSFLILSFSILKIS